MTLASRPAIIIGAAKPNQILLTLPLAVLGGQVPGPAYTGNENCEAVKFAQCTDSLMVEAINQTINCFQEIDVGLPCDSFTGSWPYYPGFTYYRLSKIAHLSLPKTSAGYPNPVSTN